MSRSVVVLWSGGLDSTVLLEKARQDGRLHTALWFRYPHPANSYEYTAAEKMRRTMPDLPYVELAAPLFGTDALATGIGTPGPRVVPGRNAVFISLAVNYAAATGADEVWFGANREDAADYPDCRLAFIDAMNIASRPFGVHVFAPLMHSTRAQILKDAARLGVDPAACWSCYEPRDGKPCGECNSCRQ